MKKDTVWLVVAVVLLIGVVGGLVWIFGGFSGDGPEVPEVTDDQANEAEMDQEEQEEAPQEEEDTGDPNDTTEEDEELGDVEIDSGVDYSTSNQSVGEDTEELFTLDDIEVTKGEEAMEIQFTFSDDEITEESSVPVTASNKSSLGAMEILISNVESDGTGMAYDESVSVNREGISRLTKVVSGIENTVKYSLGFADAPEYYLYEPEVIGNSLIVKLSIKYPGGELSTEDIGTMEFTSEDVTVESSTADEGVRISGYSYSVSGGVLRYVLKTSTNTGGPIPSFEGSISEGILTVVFPSLNADVTYSATEGNVSLPGGVTLNISRSGSQSTYEFVGVGEEYKLYGVTSPNQVIVEVQL
jgi:hypothetical protein